MKIIMLFSCGTILKDDWAKILFSVLRAFQVSSILLNQGPYGLSALSISTLQVIVKLILGFSDSTVVEQFRTRCLYRRHPSSLVIIDMIFETMADHRLNYRLLEHVFTGFHQSPSQSQLESRKLIYQGLTYHALIITS